MAKKFVKRKSEPLLDPSRKVFRKKSKLPLTIIQVQRHDTTLPRAWYDMVMGGARLEFDDRVLAHDAMMRLRGVSNGLRYRVATITDEV